MRNVTLGLFNAELSSMGNVTLGLFDAHPLSVSNVTLGLFNAELPSQYEQHYVRSV